ncbi:MAG: signal recognition particle-docking protein FtsY [Oscillospiraceae bacterium]|nr:signal recognition particle-docking protein FtsY [Oscillospiraceae bacterium]
MGFFEKLSEGLKKTRDSLVYGLRGEKPDEEFYEELEERLILADAGAETALALVGELRNEVERNLVTDSEGALELFKKICADKLRAEDELDFSGSPTVLMLIGVNGAGKTTTTGKLANLYTKLGKKLVIAAADTFRAAAAEQLRVWAERAGVDMIEGANDPAAVVFDAVSSAKRRGADIVIADTAGRLHNKKNLMDELARMTRIVKKASETAEVRTLLVLDAVTGRNAVNQAREFAKGAGVDGIVLTKLDGSAKGGAVLSIKEELGIPVRFIGVGEGIDDLDLFDAGQFSEAMFG